MYPKNFSDWVHPAWHIRNHDWMNHHIFRNEMKGIGRKLHLTWHQWVPHEIAHAVVVEGDDCLRPDFGLPAWFQKENKALPNWITRIEIEVLCVQELLQNELEWDVTYPRWNMEDLDSLLDGDNQISNMTARTHRIIINKHRKNLTIEACWRRLQQTHAIWDAHIKENP